jgi:hypothetical protein
MKKANSLYRRFHGRTPEVSGQLAWPTAPEGVVVLGRAIAIEYECNKLNGGGDGELAVYRHDFHKDDVLLATPDGKMLVVVGPKLNVETRGIVH